MNDKLCVCHKILFAFHKMFVQPQVPTFLRLVTVVRLLRVILNKSCYFSLQIIVKEASAASSVDMIPYACILLIQT